MNDDVIIIIYYICSVIVVIRHNMSFIRVELCQNIRKSKLVET